MSKTSVLLVQRGITAQTHSVSGKSLKSYGFATQSPGHGGVVLKMSLADYTAAAHDIVGNSQPQQQWVPEFVFEVDAPKDRGKCCVPAGCINEADYRSGMDLYCSGHAPNDAEALYEGAPGIGSFPMGKAPDTAADVLQTVNERPSIVEKGATDAPVESISPNVGSAEEAATAEGRLPGGVERPERIPAYTGAKAAIIEGDGTGATATAVTASSEAPTPAPTAEKPVNVVEAVAERVIEKILPQITSQISEQMSGFMAQLQKRQVTPTPKRQVKPTVQSEQSVLRAQAKNLGINVFQKSNDQLKKEIAAAANPEGEGAKT